MNPILKPSRQEVIPVLRKESGKSKNGNVVWLGEILEEIEME